LLPADPFHPCRVAGNNLIISGSPLQNLTTAILQRKFPTIRMKDSTKKRPAFQVDNTLIGLGILCFILFCKVQFVGQRNFTWQLPFTQSEWFSPSKEEATSQLLKGNSGTAAIKTMNL